MKKFLLYITLLMATSASAANFTHIKTGIVNYASSSIPESLRARVVEWEAHHFDFFIGGVNPLPYNSNAKWAGYNTVIGTYSKQLPPVKAWADAEGYVFEDMLAHMKVNYKGRTSYWVDMQKFDNFELNASNKAINGILKANGATYTDYSEAAYVSSSSTSLVPVTGHLYVGYSTAQFSEVNFIMYTSGAGLNASWEYWNGTTWAPLTVTDGTNGLSQNGKVSFAPPGNWTKASISGSSNRWWLRLNYVSATTTPVIAKCNGANGAVYYKYLTSTAAYASSSTGLTLNDDVYFGYFEPFDQVNLRVGTVADNLSATWEYWTGIEWAALSVTDATDGLTHDGRVSFTPPSDWARQSINGSNNKWWVRLNFASATTSPVIWDVRGDDWRADPNDPKQCRGWDETDENIINVGFGPLEYNPAPPAHATAKFRHQARVTGYWGANYVFINPANVQDDVRPWAAYKAEAELIPSAQTIGYIGSMSDSCAGPMTVGVYPGDNPHLVNPAKPELSTDFVDYTTDTWTNQGLAMYQEMGEIVKSSVPAWTLGANTYIKATLEYSDWILVEDFSDAVGVTVSDYGIQPTIISFDSVLPANNPTGKQIIIMYNDVLDQRVPSVTYGGGYAFWDRANRGPILALAAYYIGANEHTYFHYFTFGAARYNETDEVHVYDANTATLTQAVTANATTVTKWLYGDFTGFPSSTSTAPLRVKVDNEILSVVKATGVDDRVSTTAAIYNNHSLGAVVKYPRAARQSDGQFYSVNDVWRWGNWFPAMGVNVGVPDTNGYNGGARDMNYATDTWRRDYTNAIVLLRHAWYYSTAAQFSTPGTPIALGATYYPLQADGITGSGVTSIALRAGEGAILMKYPITLGAPEDPPPHPVVPTMTGSTTGSIH